MLNYYQAHLAVIISLAKSFPKKIIVQFFKNLKLIRYLELTIPVISRLPFGFDAI